MTERAFAVTISRGSANLLADRAASLEQEARARYIMSAALALDNGFVVASFISQGDKTFRIGTLVPEARNVNWDNHIYQYDTVSKAIRPVLNGLTRSQKSKIIGQLANLAKDDFVVIRGPDQRRV